MSYLKVFPRWEYLLLTLGILLFCGGALAQTTQVVTVTYNWAPPAGWADPTYTAPFNPATDITGYEFRLNSGSVQVAGNATNYVKVYTLPAGSCVKDIAAARAKAALWGAWSQDYPINLCPPNSVTIKWTATVELK